MRIVVADNVVKPIVPLYSRRDVTFSNIEEDLCDNGFKVWTSGILNNSTTLKYSDGNFISLRKDAITSDLVYDSSATPVLYVGNCFIRGDNGEYLNISLSGELEFISEFGRDSNAVFNIYELYDIGLEDNIFIITNGLYILTVNVSNELEVTIKKGSSVLASQKFLFSLSSGNFYTLINETNTISFNGVSIFESVDMNLVSFSLLYDISDYKNSGFDTNSKWISYDIINDPSYNKSERLLKISDTIVDDLSVDYMVTAAPLGNDLIFDTNVNYMVFNMMPLNTFSTVTGDTRVSEVIPTNESLKIRDYLDVNINETQTVSSSNIQLSFNGIGGLIQDFESGVEKYFHIPDSFSNIALKDDTSLKLAGATSGTTPETSDKIYKYNVTDQTSTPWTNVNIDGSADGTWVGAWLHRKSDGSSEWVTYNSDTELYEESEMILEKRGYYKYLKVGDTSERIDEIVLGPNYRNAVIYINNMSIYENPNNNKFLISDVSEYGNNAVVNLSDNANTVTTEVGNNISALLLNGSATIDIPASITYKNLTNKTLSLFGYMDDWISTDIPSYVLVTDQYKNGFSVSWINHGLYEISALPDPTNNVVNILNSDGTFINSVFLDSYHSGSVAVSIIDNNMFVISYLIDTDITRLLLVSSNGDKLRSKDHNSIVITNLIYGGYGTIYATTDTEIYSLNPASLEITYIDSKNANDTLVIKSDGSSGVEYDIIPNSVKGDITADGQSIIYIDENSNVYINTEPMLLSVDEKPLDVCFDSNNKAYYIVYDETLDNGVLKLTIVDFSTRYQETRKILLSDIGVIANPKGTLGLSKMNIDGVFTDVVIAQINSNQYAIYDTISQSVIKISSFSGIGDKDFDVFGDTTGYKYNKVANYNFDNMPRIQYLTTAYNGVENILEIREISSNIMNAFWNHFCIITYEVGDDLNSKLYINADEKWEITTNILGEYETNLTFGCSATTGSPLSVVNGVENRSMFGAISNILLINKVLEPIDITLLYGKLSGGGTTMRWVIGGDANTFVEEISRIFKCKQPSSKSTYFDINLTGNFSENEKELIEDFINTNIDAIIPMNSKLLSINWN